MSRYKSAISGQAAHIMTLRIVIGLLFVALIYVAHGWSKAPEKLIVDIPPDLREGTSMPVNYRNPSNVYAFGLYIFQQLNNWPKSGSDDYFNRIKTLECYFTPDFLQVLELDLNKKQSLNQLSNKRAISEIPGRHYEARRIYSETANSWVVLYDLNLQETYLNEIVKNIFAQYSLRIVRLTQNPECNPFGLAIDGYYGRPKRIEEFKVKTSQVGSEL